MTINASQRIERLSANIADLLSVRAHLQPVETSILNFAGAAASVGLHILDKASEATNIGLKRHEIVTIPETTRLLQQIRDLESSGVQPQNFESLKSIIETRTAAIEDEISSHQKHKIRSIDPDLEMTVAKKSPQSRIEIFIRRSSSDLSLLERIGDFPRSKKEESDFNAALFADYTSADLPQEEQDLIKDRIAKNEVLRRYSHDDLIVILKFRTIFNKIVSYGYGVHPRRRPLFSKARRNVIWSTSRIGMIMVTHVPSWKKYDEIGKILLNLRRYDQHMKDLVLVPEDDDYFDHKSPLIQAIREDAWKIRSKSDAVMRDFLKGPSLHRFPPEMSAVAPWESEALPQIFMERSALISNAMAISGIGGKAERDMALSKPAIQEIENNEKMSQGGVLSFIGGLFR